MEKRNPKSRLLPRAGDESTARREARVCAVNHRHNETGKQVTERERESWRELIRRVKIEVTIEERTFKTVAYVRDPAKAGNEPGYQNLMRVTARTAGDMMCNELEAVSFDLGRVIGLAEAKAVELPGVAEKVTTIKTQVDRLAAGM